ncbi:MAG: hypothetical protein KAS87_00570 [Candidatus Omnitrophica bacterium]|nr:hypothetical protein [Candidatus Omnitrophota bacterium]
MIKKKHYKKRGADVQRFIDEYERSKDNFTVTPDPIICCGEYLTSEETRLWQILRKRVKNKRHDGYYKVPVMPTTQSLLSKLMGVDIRQVQRILTSLEEKKLIGVERIRGKENVYWLINLADVVAEYKKWVERWQGGIRSILFTTKEGKENWKNDYLRKYKAKEK